MTFPWHYITAYQQPSSYVRDKTVSVFGWHISCKVIYFVSWTYVKCCKHYIYIQYNEKFSILFSRFCASSFNILIDGKLIIPSLRSQIIYQNCFTQSRSLTEYYLWSQENHFCFMDYWYELFYTYLKQVALRFWYDIYRIVYFANHKIMFFSLPINKRI